MLYMPRNTKSYGYKSLKEGMINYGDKCTSLLMDGKEVCQAVLIEGDSYLKQDGLTYAIRCTKGYTPQHLKAVREFLWELMDVWTSEDDLFDCFFYDKWFVVTKDGRDLSAPIPCDDYRELERLPNGNPLGNTAEATVEPLRASEEVSKDTVVSTDTEGTPDKATHYKGAVEPLEVMASILSKEEFIGFLKGNVIKYSYRAGRKQGESGKKDRNKFTVYSQWLHQVTNVEPIELDGKTITIK